MSLKQATFRFVEDNPKQSKGKIRGQLGIPDAPIDAKRLPCFPITATWWRDGRITLHTEGEQSETVIKRVSKNKDYDWGLFRTWLIAYGIDKDLLPPHRNKDEFKNKSRKRKQ